MLSIAPLKNRLLQALVAFAAFMGVAASGVAVYLLTVDVSRQIEALATANSDTAHFSIAQMDVEYLTFQLEVNKALTGESDLTQLRRRFDIVYGRTEMLWVGSSFSFVREHPSLTADIAMIRDFVKRTADLIDSNDADLLRALPRIAAEMESLRPVVRRVTLRATGIYSAVADERRALASDTLLRVVWLTLGLVAVLFVMVGFLSFLVQQLRSRAHALSVASARLEAIIGSALDAVLVIDDEGRIASYNGAAEQMFGRCAANAIGVGLSAFVIPPEDGLQAEFGRAIAGDGMARLDGLRADGTTFPIECSVARTTSAEGVIHVCFMRDISERLAAERELVAARDSALAGEKAKSNLLAVMSHEMRTPLNGMLGTTELLHDTGLTERQAALVGIIQRSGRLLMRHVNDVLDVSRLEAGKMSVAEIAFDAAALLTEIAELTENQAANGNNVLTVVVEDPRLGAVMGDPNKVEHIVTNLLGNAIKFTRNGRIQLSARVVRDAWLEFAVSDTGIGIAPEDQRRIFEDFVTLDASYGRASEGTGLGLSISRRLAQAMGGTLDVQSRVGEGSIFRLRIPFRAAEPAVAPAGAVDTGAAPVDAPLPALDVLVVEDNEINRFVVRSMLEGEGHRVEEAVNGALGVAAASERRYDLILMDISMPQMDGTAATRAIRSGDGPCRTVPIIALTAHAMPADLARFHEAGMTAVLTKPLTRDGLRDRLRQVAAERPAAPDMAPAAPAPTGPDPADPPAKARKPRAPKTTTAKGAPRRKSPKGPPPVDFSQPESLVDGLGAEMFRGLLDRYLAETEAGLADLKAGVEAAQDPASLAALAHKLAGTAAMFGATGLRAALVALETDVKGGETSTLAHHTEAALAVWPATRAAFARF